MRLLPTKDQWRAWSLPSRLTAIGTYLTIFSFLVWVAGFASAIIQNRNGMSIHFEEHYENTKGFGSFYDSETKDLTILSSRFPVVAGLRNEDFMKYMNTRIKSVAYEGVDRQDLYEYRTDFTLAAENSMIVSIYASERAYYYGAANYPFIYKSLNFDLINEREFNLSDALFPAAREFFEDEAENYLHERGVASFIGKGEIRPNYFNSLKDQSFAIQGDMLLLLFSSYEIASGSDGAFEIPIPLHKIRSYLRPGAILDLYYSSIYLNGQP